MSTPLDDDHDPKQPVKKTASSDALDDSSPASAHNSYYANDDTSWGARWSRLILRITHEPISKLLVKLSGLAVRNPKRTVVAIVSLSFFILLAGLFTNFNVDVDEDTLWSPKRSRPMDHRKWIEEDSGFTLEPRYFLINIHANGQNVLSAEGVRRVFSALDAVRDAPNYDQVCVEGTVQREGADNTCFVNAVTAFWNNSYSIYRQQNLTDAQVRIALSAPTYPDGRTVDQESILGTNVFDSEGIILSSLVYETRINLPETDNAEEFEETALDRIFELQDQWDAEGTRYTLEVFAERSFSDEFTRAIVTDIPLVPMVFIVMSIFTCLIFFKKDKVHSKTILGFGAVVSVLLSILTGYGLLFLCGVPFTSMTQILPFIMFGIGMDAAFILSGSFHRTDPNKSIDDRIEETVRDVGVSIALTTTTSAFAFALGCVSSVPAVYWLCLYAFPTIIIDFLYQMTFFVALMVIDERRVQENRRDCCTWITVQDEDDEVENNNIVREAEESLIDRAMVWYANKLLQPWVKVVVLVCFAALAGGCGYSASLLTQAFEFTDVVPSDSYIKPFWDSYNDYSSRGGFLIEAYFRNVDQTSPDVRNQMQNYVSDLVDMKQVEVNPPFFWVADFNTYVADREEIQAKPFQEQFDAFFAEDVNQKLYSDSIVVDDTNKILSSRVTFFMTNIQDEEVSELIEALEDQRSVSAAQPVNQGKDDWDFFTYASMYLIWQFYSVAVEELVLSTILGIVSVCVLTLLFTPHWTAIFFVAPLISILYIDLLGVLQFAGIHINAVSYIAMVMSIGLLVDFLIHTLLRYYEIPGDRRTRTVEMLRTMGSSVFLGGVSTFLGVIPLAFSTSEIFTTIFVTFMGLVSLGIGHGLILLPVLLSICGPEMNGAGNNDDDADEPVSEGNGGNVAGRSSSKSLDHDDEQSA